MVVRLGGYARISLDKSGEELGVERQRRDYRQVAGVRPGWVLARDYIDNDVSAFKRNVVRPEFERLLVDLQSGVIDGVIAYDLDRLARQPRDLERLIDVFEERPALVFCTVTNDIDLSTSDGRTMARVMVAFANKASADTGRRVARKHRELADAGKNGGGFPPFGWKEDRVTIHPEQAALIRKAHDDLLAGTRLSTIVKEWQAQNVQTSRNTGNPITRVAVKGILRNPRLAGFRTVKGQKHIGTDGKPVMGVWEPICTPEKLDAVTAVLEGVRSRYTTSNQSNNQKYLLSGILRCAECGTRMLANMRSSWKEGSKGSRFVYRCPAANDGGCGKMSRAGESLDRHIIDLIHDAEATSKAPINKAAEWKGAARFAEVTQEISELIAAMNTKRISAATAIAMLEPLERERDELEYERNRHMVEKVKATAATVELSEEFERLPIERQRAVILKHVRAIVVRSAGRGARKFNPDLLDVVWTA
ncbi:recombinase family protein [Streptomyces sp. NRRL B-24085]|uniref:recombinase family protein n=1 Tax=Streptomyces sp. NRRL B-24085 TaxID=1709476 RepID=UPI0006B3206E|nr:recombinase family protein [Streptomyces sp. NRRL B-24085]